MLVVMLMVVMVVMVEAVVVAVVVVVVLLVVMAMVCGGAVVLPLRPVRGNPMIACCLFHVHVPFTRGCC